MSSSSLKHELLVDRIIAREGGFVNDQVDKGGKTIHGISEKAHPTAWKNGPPSLDDARAIYEQKYIKPLEAFRNHPAFEQMVDYSVHSGKGILVQKLQHIVGAEVDGILGPETIEKVNNFDPIRLNNKLALERVKMIGRIIQKNPSQSKFAVGWLSRALDFLKF